ncbi:HDOD domain-containing protein [Teredinibacter franksiae]|uniref:HDOD domain-containing protein n=1 Tax=Teredinibacter franksiae TaxID=2761453 RepID=UPI00162477FD|nr:HDOD domain-containing protein [Teredinibacter franksiae]
MHESYSVYKSLVQKVMLDPEQLPSLPAVTLNIRTALNDERVTSERLAVICSKDPAFSALLMATVSSPLYAQSSPPTTLAAVISLLGLPRVSSLAMAHSVKSLFILRSANVTKMYQQIWQRLMIKSGVSSFLSLKIKKGVPEQVMLAALLSEVGTLGILSALKEGREFPDSKTFYQLCREYSKGFGAILLSKWEIEREFIDVLKFCGRWKNTSAGELNTLDLVNLGLYATVKLINPRNNLPPITEIPSYKKLTPPFNALNEQGSLCIVSDHLDEIESIKKVLA